MNLKPLNTLVLIEPIIKDKTIGGLIIVSNEKPQEATVIAVADKVEGIHVGDVVIAEKWSGKEIILDGKKLYFVDEKEILVVLS